jgi:hypothetical protein
MLCPQLPDEQSIALGEKRLEKAAQILGKDVLQRLLIFALYILGFNREFVARLFGYQVSGVKALVDRILSNGLEGFYDRRKSQTAEEKPSNFISETEEHKQIIISNAVLSVPKDDVLARKIVGVTLVESGILSNLEGAKILGYTPQAFGRLRERYKIKGSYGLIDQRQGQKSDYKVTPEVKAEIIYQICTRVKEGISVSSEDISAVVNERFPESQKISPRTIRHHLTQWGFPQVKRKLVKKN